MQRLNAQANSTLARMVDYVAHSLHNHRAGSIQVTIRRGATHQHKQISAERSGFIDGA
jgi:uncharacterized protein YggU (UPF0235/DUF167 family)